MQYRRLFAVVLTVAVAGRAWATPPIVAVETRIGGGAAFGAGRGETVVRPARLTLGVMGEFALRQDPWVTGYGEVLLEALHTAALGLRAGGRIYMPKAGVRASLGVASIVAPSTLFGPQVALGYCAKVRKKVRTCFDIDALVYLAGSDLPAHRIDAQLNGQFGVSFDAL